MDKKQKTYLWLIVIIAVLNLVILSVLWSGRPRFMSPRGGINDDEPREGFVPGNLNLSADQKTIFDKYSGEYFNLRDSIKQLIAGKKKEIFEEAFKNDSDTSKAAKLSKEIGVLNCEMENNLYKHYSNIKTILSDEQRQIFQKIITPQFNAKPELPRFQDPEDEFRLY
jgi:hypothetical protein